MNLAQAQIRRKQLELSGTPPVETGIVTSIPANNRVNVNCAGSDEEVRIPLTVVVKQFDVVLIIRNQMGLAWIIHVLAPGDLNAKGISGGLPPLPNDGVEIISAEKSASIRGTVWRTDRSDVVQGTAPGYMESKGAWFYGSTPKDLLVGATITGVQIQVTRITGGLVGDTQIHLYLHASSMPEATLTKVGTVVNADIAIGETKWITLPTAWGQTLITTGGGVMIEGSPFIVLEGIDTRPDSGALRLDWSR